MKSGDKKQKNIKSVKREKINILIAKVLFALIGIGLSILTFIFLKSSISNPYPDLIGIFFGIFFGTFAFFGFLGVFYYPDESFIERWRIFRFFKLFKDKGEQVFYICIGAIFILICLFNISFIFNPVTYNNTTNIKGEIVKIVYDEGGAKRSADINIDLKQFPDFTFQLGSSAYYEVSNEMKNDLKTGDILNLRIAMEDFHGKINRDQSLSFWRKFFNYHFITVYELRSDKKTYLSLDTEITNDRLWIILIFGGLGLLSIGISIFELNKIKKDKEIQNKISRNIHFR